MNDFNRKKKKKNYFWGNFIFNSYSSESMWKIQCDNKYVCKWICLCLVFIKYTLLKNIIQFPLDRLENTNYKVTDIEYE